MPTAAHLRNVALAHLSRHAATGATLLRVLERRIIRWAATAQPDDNQVVALRQDARDIIAGLLAQGLLNDADFADTRARRLIRSGHSRRAVAAHLAARGVEPEISRAAMASGDDLAAALATARRRRIGPFRTAAADAEGLRKEFALLARAGFGREVATRALGMGFDEAEAIVLQLKRA
jgi:regulatory protein